MLLNCLIELWFFEIQLFVYERSLYLFQLLSTVCEQFPVSFLFSFKKRFGIGLEIGLGLG